MSVRRFKVNSIKQGLSPYRDFLAGNPTYAPPGFESIATVTGTGGEAIFTFSSIPQTYKSLQIRGIVKDTYTVDTYSPSSAYIYLNFNGSYANLIGHTLYGNGSSAVAVSKGEPLAAATYMPSGASFTNMFAAVIFDLHDYASTTINKTIRAFSGNDANQASTNRAVALSSGLWINTAAITSIQINAVVSFAAGTTFALYGIKGS